MIYEYYMKTMDEGICTVELLDFEFEQELRSEYTIEDLDKAHIAYELAVKWSRECMQNSHSAKYYRIECIYKDIVELI